MASGFGQFIYTPLHVICSKKNYYSPASVCLFVCYYQFFPNDGLWVFYIVEFVLLHSGREVGVCKNMLLVVKCGRLELAAVYMKHGISGRNLFRRSLTDNGIYQ